MSVYLERAPNQMPQDTNHFPIYLAAWTCAHSFSCCHYPHVSCQGQLDGLNVWPQLVLTSILQQHFHGPKPGSLRTVMVSWTFFIIIIHFYFHISPLYWSLKAKAAWIVPA